jgi:predicted Zn-dependent protease
MIYRIIIILATLYSNIALADKPIRLISDAEIENRLKSFISPLVRAANLNPDSINIRIIGDSSLNAFVTNGTDMYINSGLIIKFADDPNVLYAVMAHEIAHIYAGHLIKMRGEVESMTKMAIGGAMLGLATIIAGAPDAGMFIGAASVNAAQRGMLQYSREHEVEADKIAVDLLYKTHNNGLGLIKFFQFMSQRDREYNPDPYLITHPLNADRIASVQNSIRTKLTSFGDNITPQIRFDFKRMATKLEAFLALPDAVLYKYKGNEYATSIAYFRLGQFTKAIELLDQVIAKEGNNPYLLELKGQFYFENGKLEKAAEYYKRSLTALPHDKIIKIELAAAQINQTTNPILLNSAISLLKQVSAVQPENLMAYFMLSRAYGKLGDQNKAILALAEYYFYQGSYEKSKILANKVLKNTSAASREYLRASDIVQFTQDSKGE